MAIMAGLGTGARNFKAYSVFPYSTVPLEHTLMSAALFLGVKVIS